MRALEKELQARARARARAQRVHNKNKRVISRYMFEQPQVDHSVHGIAVSLMIGHIFHRFLL
jgi:hypothetical protein